MDNPPISFMMTCRNFFGLKDGQTALDFGKEVFALTEADKLEIYNGFKKLGIKCALPIPKKV